jgi:hypothetical protein
MLPLINYYHHPLPHSECEGVGNKRGVATYVVLAAISWTRGLETHSMPLVVEKIGEE